ncbi:hypothetical protein [Bradyrhizobium roseum]|uniref:hypothetical protein n=1 Tax=Bradyrhizobium roseum TaxID=3056648 RepID=UPI0026265682|nr:hypothetical protein [Bradyrhizobium roseus]WKA31551.1 hypothetical protein QUH67_15930 [Bradyrhizobium roseus]
MTTDNGFQPDRPPIFLSRHAEETGHPEIEKRWDVAAISSRILKASALAAAVTTIGVGALSVGNPVLLVANVTDWWNDKPAVQLEADASGATVQTVADAQDAPAATDAPAREEVAAAAEPAAPTQAEASRREPEPVQAQAESGPRPVEVAQSQAETSPPVTEELFKQFQAWAAEEEARAASARAARARVAEDAPAQARPVKKPRRAQSVQNARAEVRPRRNQRARVREEQDAGGQAPPVADPRAPDPAPQNAQPPSFFQSLGIR